MPAQPDRAPREPQHPSAAPADRRPPAERALELQRPLSQQQVLALQRAAGNAAVARFMLSRTPDPVGTRPQPDAPARDELEELMGEREEPIEIGPQGAEPPRPRTLREEYGVVGRPPRLPTGVERLPYGELVAHAERIQQAGGGTEACPALLRLVRAAERRPEWNPFARVWQDMDAWPGGAARYREYLRLSRHRPRQEITMDDELVPAPHRQPPPPVGVPPVPAPDIPGDIVPSAPDVPGIGGGAATITSGLADIVISLGAAFGAELAGLAGDIISTLLSLPVTWLQEDSVNRFNGRIEGFALAMQEMANQYRDAQLDQLPSTRWAEFPPLRRPPVAPNWRPAYREGLEDGNLRAWNLVSGFQRAVTLSDGATVTLRGPQLMRSWYRRTNGFIAAEIMRTVNARLRALGKPPWPIPVSAGTLPNLP